MQRTVEENYILFQASSVENIVDTLSKESTDVILDLSAVENLSHEILQTLTNALRPIITADKTVIVVVNNKSWISDDSEQDIQVVPSLSEATDMLFMIQLERQL